MKVHYGALLQVVYATGFVPVVSLKARWGIPSNQDNVAWTFVHGIGADGVFTGNGAETMFRFQ
jgi:hypothetical protein